MAETLAEALHLYAAGRLQEAGDVCRALVARDPRCGEAWDRLARIAERQNYPEQAEAHYERAIATLGDPSEAHNNLGVLLQRRGEFEAAMAHYHRAVELGLRHALLFSNLGCLLRDLGHLQDGVTQLERAVEIDPSAAHAHSNLGVTLALQGRSERAFHHLRLAVALQPHWDLAHSNLLFCLNYSDTVTPIEVAAQHRAFGRRHPDPEGARPHTDPDPDRKLRVGLVSPDLKQHSVAYFLEPLLTAYDRQAFEYFCYSDVIRPDRVTERMRAAVDRWRPIRGLSDADAAHLIRADRIDILIDLAGHTANNRMALFGARAAPVQMSYLGYPNSTGLPAVDWRITDEWADPPGMTAGLHSEELLRLPGGFLCFQPRAASPEPSPLPARVAGRVTFGSFNLQAKISPTVIALWAAILDRVPGSRLCLKGPAFADPATRAIFEQRLASSPLAGHAVELLSHLDAERDHLAAYGRIDIALDTWPYGGTTTTCEALWMGVPVVTLAGRAHVSRVGVSLLTRLGQSDLIAQNAEDYVTIAARLAADLDGLEARRASLRGRMSRSGITDAAACTRALGSALRFAWRHWCQKVSAARAPLPPGETLAPLVGNLQVVVAASLEQITPYVLAEQHDWFEDELDLVRNLLARGERAIDVGANHGVYALTMAHAVGLTGRVWAFEPGRTVAARLRRSLAINGYCSPQATLIEAALSHREGTAELQTGVQSELNQLRPSDGARPPARAADSMVEEVALLTLDGSAARLGLRDIAFIKIDAEGAEADIVDGGRRFFQIESPLVMFEVRHGAAINLHLIERFEGLGYASYRLTPGLGILAPLGAGELRDLDPFQLNVFACKSDRARALEQRGLLAMQADVINSVPAAPGGAWRAYLQAQLFAAPLWPRWAGWTDAQARGPLDQAYQSALDHYAMARRITERPGVRHAHLVQALRAVSAVAQQAPTIPVLQTLARIAWEAGHRTASIGALNLIVERCSNSSEAELALDQPFLPVSPRFDDVRPAEAAGEPGRWVMAAALEQRERLRAFSSFYTATEPVTLACLETIASLGYASPEMTRRLELVRRRRQPT